MFDKVRNINFWILDGHEYSIREHNIIKNLPPKTKNIN